MSERRRAGRAGRAGKAAKAPRRNLSANARRVADVIRKRGFSPEDVVKDVTRKPKATRSRTPQLKPDLGKMEKVLEKFGKARKMPKPPRRRRPGPITSPGGSLPVDPKQKPMPRKKPGPITGKPVPPPGGKPPMQKPMPVMPGPGPVVGKPVPAPPPGSNPPMPGIKPKPPGGFRKGGTVGGAKKKGKAKIRGAGIERKGLRKAKMY